MKNYFKVIVLIGLLSVSCKTTKPTTKAANVKASSTKKIINKHYKAFFNENTVYAKIKAKYKDDKTSVALSIKLRMEKDRVIWMSATKLGIPIAKIMITPTKVRYYEKIKKTYFEGDFSLLSNFLGTDLTFTEVQNLLLGQAVLNLKKGKYKSGLKNDLYFLTPKEASSLYTILFLINPENYKLKKQEIQRLDNNQKLSVTYLSYKNIEETYFPKNMILKVIDSKKTTTLHLDFKLVFFNKELTFPFTIPRGYKEINLN